jgi:hypothetical protein
MTEAQIDDRLYEEQKDFSDMLLVALREHRLSLEQFLYLPRPRTFWLTMSKLTKQSPEACMRYFRKHEGDVLYWLIQAIPASKRRRRR